MARAMAGELRERARRRALLRLLALALLLGGVGGCVTVAEFRKLERRVQDMQGGRAATADSAAERQRIADLAAEVQRLSREVEQLSGKLEVAEHRTQQAVKEARAARSEAATAGPAGALPAPGGASAEDPDVPAAAAGASSEEISAYRAAYAAWRSNEPQTCIDRFRGFLQTYPNSSYADDAAYWMADCYFKHGDYKTAVLRFDDVVARYPRGNKAADALYRQGEALLRLGPGYGNAAGKAFERVLKDYPDSARAPEAKRQLDLLGAG